MYAYTPSLNLTHVANQVVDRFCHVMHCIWLSGELALALAPSLQTREAHHNVNMSTC